MAASKLLSSSIVALVFVLTAAAATAQGRAPDEEIPRVVTIAIAAHAAASVADLTTTSLALSRNLNAREMNPLLRPLTPHPAAFAVVGGALSSTVNYGLWKMAARHPKRAALAATALTVLEVSVAIHNMDVARRAR